jgi:hypothetical protein
MESVCFCDGSGPESVFVALLIAFTVFVSLIILAIKIFIFCKIFSKAGYSWALGLLMLVPIANIIMFFFIGLADWPIRKELRRMKQQTPA